MLTNCTFSCICNTRLIYVVRNHLGGFEKKVMGGGFEKNGFSYMVIHLMDLPALEPICLLSEVLGVWTVPFLPIVV